MATFKQAPGPESHYTMVPNSLARSDLPPRAKAVYLLLRSHRSGWSLTTRRIGEAIGMNRETVGRAVDDLERAGYIVREQVREGGKFGEVSYTVLATPVENPAVAGKTGDGKNRPTVAGKTGDGKTGDGKSGHIRRPIPKKTILEEDQEKTPCSPPEGDEGGGEVALIEDPERPASSGYPPAFEAWWADYPKKTGKGDAFRKWKAAKKGIGADELHTRLLDRLPGLLATQQRDPRYVPNPATWLNQGRYDDPVEEAAQPMTQTQKRQQSIIDAANQLFAQEVSHDRPAIG